MVSYFINLFRSIEPFQINFMPSSLYITKFFSFFKTVASEANIYIALVPVCNVEVMAKVHRIFANNWAKFTTIQLCYWAKSLKLDRSVGGLTNYQKKMKWIVNRCKVWQYRVLYFRVLFGWKLSHSPCSKKIIVIASDYYILFEFRKSKAYIFRIS